MHKLDTTTSLNIDRAIAEVGRRTVPGSSPSPQAAFMIGRFVQEAMVLKRSKQPLVQIEVPSVAMKRLCGGKYTVKSLVLDEVEEILGVRPTDHGYLVAMHCSQFTLPREFLKRVFGPLASLWSDTKELISSLWNDARQLWNSSGGGNASSLSTPVKEGSPCEDVWAWMSKQTGVRWGTKKREVKIGDVTYNQARNGVLFCEHSSMKQADKAKKFGGVLDDVVSADLAVASAKYVKELFEVVRSHVDGSSPMNKSDKFILQCMMHGFQWWNWRDSATNKQEWDERNEAGLGCKQRHGDLMKAIRRKRKEMLRHGLDLGMEVMRDRSRFLNDVAIEQQRLHGDVILLEQDALRTRNGVDPHIVEKMKLKHGLPLVKFRVK